MKKFPRNSHGVFSPVCCPKPKKVNFGQLLRRLTLGRRRSLTWPNDPFARHRFASPTTPKQPLAVATTVPTCASSHIPRWQSSSICRHESEPERAALSATRVGNAIPQQPLTSVWQPSVSRRSATTMPWLPPQACSRSNPSLPGAGSGLASGRPDRGGASRGGRPHIGSASSPSRVACRLPSCPGPDLRVPRAIGGRTAATAARHNTVEGKGGQRRRDVLWAWAEGARITAVGRANHQRRRFEQLHRLW